MTEICPKKIGIHFSPHTAHMYAICFDSTENYFKMSLI